MSDAPKQNPLVPAWYLVIDADGMPDYGVAHDPVYDGWAKDQCHDHIKCLGDNSPREAAKLKVRAAYSQETIDSIHKEMRELIRQRNDLAAMLKRVLYKTRSEPALADFHKGATEYMTRKGLFSIIRTMGAGHE